MNRFTRLSAILPWLILAPAGASAATKSLLIYGPTSGCLEESVPGTTVTIWDAATWASKTTADFAAFDAIVFEDCPSCGFTESVWSTALANQNVWGPAVTGNMILIGTDPDLHGGGGGAPVSLINGGILFAADDPAPGPGLYISLGCVYDALSSPVTFRLMSYFGTFMVLGSGCNDSVMKLASHPALAGVTSSTLSNWGCSTHDAFTSWPPSFVPLAMAVTTTGPYTAGDGTRGLVYILASGASVIPVWSATTTPTLTTWGTLTWSPTRSATPTVTATRTPTPSFTLTVTPTWSSTFTITRTFTVTPTPGPRVLFEKRALQDFVNPGEECVFTLTYRNTGNQDATATTLWDSFPAGLSPPGIPPLGGSVLPGAIQWSLGDLAPGDEGTLALTFTASAAVTTAGLLLNQAWVRYVNPLNGEVAVVPGQDSVQLTWPDDLKVSRNAFRPALGGTVVVGLASPRQGRYQVQIYNSAGELIRRLFDQTLPLSSHVTVEWDGRNAFGEPAASGVYLIQVSAPTFAAIKKVALLR